MLVSVQQSSIHLSDRYYLDSTIYDVAIETLKDFARNWKVESSVASELVDVPSNGFSRQRRAYSLVGDILIVLRLEREGIGNVVYFICASDGPTPSDYKILLLCINNNILEESH
jgi:hypothetical protein